MIEKQVKETLGQEFEVLDLQIHDGSAVLLIALGVLGTVFMGFSRYESFVKSVSLLVSPLSGGIQHFVRREFDIPDLAVTVEGSWRAGPALTVADQMYNSASGTDSCQFLLAYLILSHAVLLGLLAWLVARHLK